MTEKSRPEKSWYPIVIFISLILIIIISDQYTKWLVVNNFSLHESKVIIKDFFNLTYILNSGAAFGLLAGEPNAWRHGFFITVAVIALVMMIFLFRQLKDKSMLFVYALGMIAGGAVGNLTDRLRTGMVVDFLDFYIAIIDWHWPAFNVADSAITTGIGLFLLANFLYPESLDN
jgi:signal peptidase II